MSSLITNQPLAIIEIDDNYSPSILPEINVSEKFNRTSSLLKSVNILTKRETQILYLISEGFRTAQVAEQLFISASTVSTHRKHMIRKLNAKSTAHLVGIAKNIGLI